LSGAFYARMRVRSGSRTNIS